MKCFYCGGELSITENWNGISGKCFECWKKSEFDIQVLENKLFNDLKEISELKGRIEVLLQ
jgi:hypothetical protein